MSNPLNQKNTNLSPDPFLLIDNSNTVTKLVLGSAQKGLGEPQSIRTQDLNASSLKALINAHFLGKFQAVCLSSVVPLKEQLLTQYFNDYPFHSISHTSLLPIQIQYPHPEQIGADRIANSVAASQRHKGPSIVIDFGTAVTFDVLNWSDSHPEQLAYLGGVIAPGLDALTDYLAEKTALLPRVQLKKPPSVIGTSTTHAMQAGAFFGYRGLIRALIEELKQELGAHPAILATGGHAKLISTEMNEIQEVIPSLTLEGIYRLACCNSSLKK